MDKATVVLVACSSSKLDHRAPARNLYTSTLFKLARRYAETQAKWWYILSARHGLVRPSDCLEPYDEVLPRSSVARELWALDVADLLDQWWGIPSSTKVVILGGQRYAEPLASILQERGYEVSLPLKGKGIGKMQAWLKAHTP